MRHIVYGAGGIGGVKGACALFDTTISSLTTSTRSGVKSCVNTLSRGADTVSCEVFSLVRTGAGPHLPKLGHLDSNRLASVQDVLLRPLTPTKTIVRFDPSL